MKFLAKSNNIELIGHLKRVQKFAVEIAGTSISKRDDKEDIIEIISLSALLHDIGKITTSFQAMLETEQTSESLKFRHNEIGWAIITKFLKHKNSNIIASCIYWHHGISNKMSEFTVDDILYGIDETQFLSFLKELIDPSLIKDEYNEFDISPTTPLYFEDIALSGKDINNYNLIIRSCVISADRIVSKLEEEIINNNNTVGLSLDEINNLVETNLPNITDYIKDFIKKEKFVLDINPEFDNERFKIQQDIVSKCGKTTIINAPGGYGKTIMGILWSNKTKLIFVLPRNSIALSVYDRVTEDINSLGIKNCSIELFLSGEAKKSNTGNFAGFQSDIIITNIDNYLKPMIDNSNMDRLYTILSSDVIFDEYDELISDAALFAGFINIMQVRNRYSNSRTLLLSATFQNIAPYWHNSNDKTTILPEKWKHYNAAHNKKFIINIENEFTEKDIDGCNKLLVVNSVSLAQELKKNKFNSILIHSEFETKVREQILAEIIELYGKHSNYTDKKIVFGTHYIQTSFDISFKEVFDSIISPASTIQRGARLNRHGLYEDNESILNIRKIDSLSELNMADILYDKKLREKWFEFIKTFNKQSITLDTLYEIYNDFHKTNEKDINFYIKSRLTESYKCLSKIYPIKYNINSVKNNTYTAGSNKLRSTGNEVFIIARKFGTQNEYCDVFTQELYSGRFDKTFSIKPNNFNNIIKVMRELKDDERFNFKEVLKIKNLTEEDIQKKWCKKSDTPYIRFDEFYHEDYGFIKATFFTEQKLQLN